MSAFHPRRSVSAGIRAISSESGTFNIHRVSAFELLHGTGFLPPLSAPIRRGVLLQKGTQRLQAGLDLTGAEVFF